jgi:hypothetical protein
MLRVTYAEGHFKAFMLIVTFKPFMLIAVVMLSVIMLNVVMLSVMAPKKVRRKHELTVELAGGLRVEHQSTLVLCL